MTPLRKSDWAIEAVARRFSATWQTCNTDSAAGFLTIDGERIAIEIAVIAPKKTAPDAPTRPRLRFDRVALGLIARLQAGLIDSVPDGQAVVITITAPIRLASRTAAVVQETIRQRLARRAVRLRIDETINGNRVRARLLEDLSRRASRVVGFVHNPDSDAKILFDTSESLLRHIGAAAGTRNPKKRFPGNRWLVLACSARQPPFDTYRQVFSQLAIPTDFKKVLLVLPGGRVEALAG